MPSDAAADLARGPTSSREVFSPTELTHRSMSLFVDKHRPTKLDDLHFHHDLSQRIRSLVR